eukprot:TRINITY_DN1589_c0_g2_i1.p1 TRINITY_DN1589_c0_g2~~TRINITY_DN1589_c0_g2_i1.p1  ORF type:complete len:326 (+),score=28.03 TRINITY_DN1589_c0_g2_i1:81-980(+)
MPAAAAAAAASADPAPPRPGAGGERVPVDHSVDPWADEWNAQDSGGADFFESAFQKAVPEVLTDALSMFYNSVLGPAEEDDDEEKESDSNWTSRLCPAGVQSTEAMPPSGSIKWEPCGGVPLRSSTNGMRAGMPSCYQGAAKYHQLGVRNSTDESTYEAARFRQPKPDRRNVPPREKAAAPDRVSDTVSVLEGVAHSFADLLPSKSADPAVLEAGYPPGYYETVYGKRIASGSHAGATRYSGLDTGAPVRTSADFAGFVPTSERGEAVRWRTPEKGGVPAAAAAHSGFVDAPVAAAADF